MDKKDINSLLKNARENRHEEVVHGFMCLDEKDKRNEMVMMAYADSLYELGNDVMSLDAYLKLVAEHAKSKYVGTALFGAAMALKNLDLHEEALEMLSLINPDHHGLDKEIEHSVKVLNEQTKARSILNEWRK